METLIGWLGLGVVIGVIGGMITQNKGRGFWSGFLLAFFFPCIGLIIAVVLAPAQVRPLAPSGMRAVRCRRCNADQNVEIGAPSAECWQCKTEMDLSAFMPKPQPATPAVQITDGPTLAAVLDRYPNVELPRNLRVKVIKAGDPNYGKVGTVFEIKGGLAYVQFGIFGDPTPIPYELDALQPTGGQW